MNREGEEEERKPRKQISLRNDSLPVSTINNNVGREKALRSSEFEGIVRDKTETFELYKNEMFSLATQFKGLIDDRIFNENKGPIIISLEKEVIAKLANLSSKMNEDSAQPESAGSNTLCVLLMKCMLSQRDTINKLDYKISILENKIKEEDR